MVLLLPAVQAAREAAQRTQCANYRKQYGIVFHNYHERWNRFPPGSFEGVSVGGVWFRGTGGSWQVSILLFMEQTQLL